MPFVALMRSRDGNAVRDAEVPGTCIHLRYHSGLSISDVLFLEAYAQRSHTSS